VIVYRHRRAALWPCIWSSSTLL